MRIRFKRISRVTNLDRRRLFDNIFDALDRPDLIILVDYQFIYFNIFLLIMGLIQLICIRENASEMMEKITNSE